MIVTLLRKPSQEALLDRLPCGVLAIDSSRVPLFGEAPWTGGRGTGVVGRLQGSVGSLGFKGVCVPAHPGGRFPSNVLLRPGILGPDSKYFKQLGKMN